MHALKKTK